MTAQNDIEARLAELLDMLKDEEQRQVCYPVNQSFDYSALIPFLSHSLNNVGDPFHRTNYLANTHQFEREVILHFAQLTGLDPDDAWGYVTSGGTEGNMYSLYLARELFPEGMLCFSEEAHYSILKNARVLNLPHTTAHCLNKTVTQRKWLPQIKYYPKSGRQSRGKRPQQDGKTGIAGDDPRPLPSFIQEGEKPYS